MFYSFGTGVRFILFTDLTLRPPKILSRKNHPGRGGVPAPPARGQPESQRDSIIQPSVAGPSRTGEYRLRWVNVQNIFQPGTGCIAVRAHLLQPVPG